MAVETIQRLEKGTAVAVAATSPDGSNPVEPPPMTNRRVLSLAIPIIGENLLQTMVGAIDTLMVARLGKGEVAGVGAAVEFVFFIIAALSAVSVGATVLVSQAFGGGDHPAVNRIARQAVVLGLMLSVPLSLIGAVFAHDIIGLFGVEPEVVRHGGDYMRVTAATGAVLLLTFVCGAIFRGVGDSRTPLKASILANVINIAAAYLLIFGNFGFPDLGVAGSAWAAAIGRAGAAAVLLAILVRGRHRVSIRGRDGWRPSLGMGRRLFSLGFPFAIEEMFISAGFIALLAVVAKLGTAQLAAQQIGFTALSKAYWPGFGFALAVTALVGQSIGARRPQDAAKATAIALRWCLLWMTVGALIYFVLAEPTMHVFTEDDEVVEYGVRALRALALSLPFWAYWSVYGGALRGSGDTRTPMLMSVTSVWLAVALAYAAVTWFDGGIGMVWLTFLITSPIAAVGNWLALRKRLAPGSTAFDLAPPPVHP